MSAPSESPLLSGHILQAASNVVITGGAFIGAQTIVHKSNDRLEQIYERVAPNAILNTGGRADEVRCHPGTREEALAKTESWMDASKLANSHRNGIFWLSGPAGAGKSAIVQTLAERCIACRRPMVNFFFFRGDHTRNNARSLVATILFQLFDTRPELKPLVEAVLVERPLILSQSLRDQFQHLINTPLRTLREASTVHDPLVFLIDGLDECNSALKHEQQSLIKIFHDLVSSDNSPFKVLIASRPEAHLTMAFNEVGSATESIFLSDEYSHSDDIRVFVTNKLVKIKNTHHLRHTLDERWPSEDQINWIVEKSSGQFIYAATVLRYIAGRSASPAQSLDAVQGLRPANNAAPFAELDGIYTLILAQAEDWELTKDVLAAQILLNLSSSDFLIFHPNTLYPTLELLEYRDDDIHSAISDLAGILVPRETGGRLTLAFYHASLVDFLCDKTRSAQYHIDINALSDRLAAKSIKYVQGNNSLLLCAYILEHVSEPTPTITNALKSGPIIKSLPFGSSRISEDLAYKFLSDSLYSYCRQDTHLYELLVRKWFSWFRENGACFYYRPYNAKGGKIESQLMEGVWREITRATECAWVPRRKPRIIRRLLLIAQSLTGGLGRYIA